MHAARKLRRQCVNFLKMVENNFDPINSTLSDVSFLQPESIAANSGELNSGLMSSYVYLILDSLIQLFKSILSFKISHESESQNFGVKGGMYRVSSKPIALCVYKHAFIILKLIMS